MRKKPATKYKNVKRRDEFGVVRFVGAHVVIAERALGHQLPSGAEVHHFNEDRSDNSNQNLIICQSHAYHRLLHSRQRTLSAGFDPDTHKKCSDCKEYLEHARFSRSRETFDGYANDCKQCRRRAYYVRKSKRVAA